MVTGLEGIRVIEVGGAAAMPLAGMLMGTWGAEIIHVEPPGRGDIQRHLVSQGIAGWAKPHAINYLWEISNSLKGLLIPIRLHFSRQFSSLSPVAPQREKSLRGKFLHPSFPPSDVIFIPAVNIERGSASGKLRGS
jgi:hypothetical protein